MDPDNVERVLLLASKRGYQTDDFKRAAERLGLDLVLGTDRCHVLAEDWPEGALALDFLDAENAARTIEAFALTSPIRGILATDETTAVIAERARARLGLAAGTGDTPEAATGGTPGTMADTTGDHAAEIAGNKLRFRQALTRAGLAQPRFVDLPKSSTLSQVRAAMTAHGLAYPVVIKPLHLSASRGVMRADDDRALIECMARLGRLLGDPEVRARDPEAARRILIETFIPGREVAFEGLLERGTLRTLAVFDKPDPLDGPFFAETIYVTPTIEPPTMVTAIADAVHAAARVIGLSHGPVHAEVRLPDTGPVLVELAARAIGGLCHRALRFAGDVTLEELLLSHAAGRELGAAERADQLAHGVYMLPVPEFGVLRAIHGVDADADADASVARAVPHVTAVEITARVGDTVQPLPEGNTYMGFLFAEAPTRDQAIDALRQAVARIRFRIAPLL